MKGRDARVDLGAAAPQFKAAMRDLDVAAGQGLEQTLKELVRLRASQVNGCVYCIDLHSRDAKRNGETEQRLHGLAAWPEAPYYSARERAALALTDAVTMVSESHVSDEVYWQAAEQFTEIELAQLIALIVTINAWNRIAVATRLAPTLQGPAS